MIPESVPIIVNFPEFDEIEIYACHDLHYGNKYFDVHKWNEFARHVLSAPNRFVCFVGDLMESSVPNSKHSDMFEQTATPQEQQEFIESIFKMLAERTLVVVDGNHEQNRITRTCGLFPLFTACAIARIDEKYRSDYAVVDIGIGNKDGRMSRVVGFVCHRAKELKSFSSADALEGFDFMMTGHDHDPKDHSRAHITYDRQRREIGLKTVEMLNCGSFLTYGGYGARSGYRPQSNKLYKIIVHAQRNRQKMIETVGFYL